MMKAMKKTLAFLLALALIGTSGVFSTLPVQQRK